MWVKNEGLISITSLLIKRKTLFLCQINLYDFGMRKYRRLVDEYRFPGFRPKARIKGIFGDPKARIIRLAQIKKNDLRNMLAQCMEYYDKQSRSIRDLSCGVAEFIRKWMCDGYYVGNAEK